MELWALLLLIFFNLAGFIAIFFTSFGIFIILAGAVLYAFLTGFQIFSWGTLALFFGLYVLSEILEYVFIIAGSKKFGASNAAVAGAFLGGIVGAILGAGGFGIGIIFGSFLGIFFGAFLIELILQRDFVRSIKAGAGGVIGRLSAIAAKVLIALVLYSLMTAKILESVKSGREISYL